MVYQVLSHYLENKAGDAHGFQGRYYKHHESTGSNFKNLQDINVKLGILLKKVLVNIYPVNISKIVETIGATLINFAKN